MPREQQAPGHLSGGEARGEATTEKERIELTQAAAAHDAGNTASSRNVDQSQLRSVPSHFYRMNDAAGLRGPFHKLLVSSDHLASQMVLLVLSTTQATQHAARSTLGAKPQAQYPPVSPHPQMLARAPPQTPHVSTSIKSPLLYGKPQAFRGQLGWVSTCRPIMV